MKTSLAVDQKLPGNVILTLEGSYNKDINSVYFQNVNLPTTGITLAGSDPRTRFDSTRIYGGKPVANRYQSQHQRRYPDEKFEERLFLLCHFPGTENS